MDEDEQELIRRSFVQQSYPEKGWLLRQGDVCQSLFFVVQGVVRVGLIDQKGEDITTYFQTEGNFVTDYESFLRDTEANFFIQALEPVEVLRIDRYGLQQLYERTSFGNKLGRIFAEELFISTNQRLISFYTQSPEARYQALLDSQPTLINRVAQSYVASFIGVKPQSLSRIKRRAQQNISS